MSKAKRNGWRAAAGRAAEAAGVGVRAGPGLVGALFVSYGLWLAWAPLGFVAMGGFLLMADRRMP